MCKKSCLCWRDLVTPSIAVVVFSMTTSALQILVEVAIFTSSTSTDSAKGLLAQTDANGTAVKLYIALAAFDFFVILFGAVFLLGVEKNGGHRFSALPWILWVFCYIIFESAINIFFFSQRTSIFNGTVKGGYFIVPLVYWVVKDVILFIGWWCVVGRLCYWDHSTRGSSDSTLLLPTNTSTGIVNGTGPTDSFGPIYFNGASTRVPVRDNPQQYCSHFDVVRPTQSCQVYSPNWGRPTPGGFYGRDGGIYGPTRY